LSNHFPLQKKALQWVRSQIAIAAEQVQRNPDDIRIVAVTKKFPLSTLDSAFAAGLHTIGESRVQEAAVKLPQFTFRNDVETHLIGHLQSNKVRKAVQLFDVIQTVDTYTLAERINRIAGEEGKQQRIYMQVNTGADPAKHGATGSEALVMGRRIADLPNIQLEGIMTIGPVVDNPEDMHSIFRLTRQIRDNLQLEVQSCHSLSMGMTADYTIAVTEGATHIRLGTALFGARPV